MHYDNSIFYYYLNNLKSEHVILNLFLINVELHKYIAPLLIKQLLKIILKQFSIFLLIISSQKDRTYI